MAFQPFGYKFDVRSRLSPAQAKAAIRKRKKDWFERSDGARGWILGSFVCLWFSAFDRNGPMLVGWISPHGAGVRIRGRAGSDLNGVALAVPVLVTVLFLSARSLGGSILLLAVLAIGLWAKHAFRKEAEPLVRFLKAAVTDEATKRRGPAVGPLRTNLALSASGEDVATPVTADVIERTVLEVGAGGFVILSVTEEVYIQTASKDGASFIIEWRDGGAHRHFRAIRAEARTGGAPKSEQFSADEAMLAFMAFAADRPTPPILVWERM